MKTIQQFIETIQRGVDWGRIPIVKWQSTDGRYALLTRPGHRTWAGRGMTRHASVEHWVIDLSKFKDGLSGISLQRACLVLEVSGRWSKEHQKDLQNLSRENIK